MAIDRTSIRREVELFAAMLCEELGSLPMRADGCLNAKDAYEAVEDAAARYARDGVVLDATLSRIRSKSARSL
jgi:hypothetical protein